MIWGSAHNSALNHGVSNLSHCLVPASWLREILGMKEEEGRENIPGLQRLGLRCWREQSKKKGRIL